MGPLGWGGSEGAGGGAGSGGGGVRHGVSRRGRMYRFLGRLSGGVGVKRLGRRGGGVGVVGGLGRSVARTWMVPGAAGRAGFTRGLVAVDSGCS
ncbi:hypothetical protein WJX77_002295 [Trebouxia sp. C0004]